MYRRKTERLSRQDSQARDEAEDAFDNHPFPQFSDRVCLLTGLDTIELQAAATVAFNGRREIVSALLPWEDEPALRKLYADLATQYPEIAKLCGLPKCDPISSEDILVKWRKNPFYHSTAHLPKSDPRRSGSFSSGLQVLRQLGEPVILPTLTPDETELAILARHYPDADPKKPPWQDIRAHLLAGGVPVDTVNHATSLDLVRMLPRVSSHRPTERLKVADKEMMLSLLRRRGLEPIAYLCEAAWNLREWLREVAADDTLQSVLTSLLPGIRRRVELSLIDGELSGFARTLPRSDQLTAAGLFAFIEGLKLPGNSRLSPPKGKPPEGGEWQTLSRLRAIRIAMQLCKEDADQPMFNYESESDLDTIEKWDRKVLSQLFEAIERFDPLYATDRAVATKQMDTQGIDLPITVGEWSAPMSKAEIARRITGRNVARYREVQQFLAVHEIKQLSDNKWIVRLDAMDANTRLKLDGTV